MLVLLFLPLHSQNHLQNKLKILFSEKNIPATLVTKLTYPCVTITVDEPLTVTASNGNYAYTYLMELDLIDVMNGKKVILYHYAIGMNSINFKSDAAANALWGNTNGLINEFASDWKATH